MRLFVALKLPDEIRDRLGDLEQPLPGARWVPPDNFHLTLRFIGEVDGGLAHDIDTALMGIDGRGFELRLAGLGHFGEGQKTRSLYAAVAPTEPLSRLQQKVDQALQRLGLAPEGRKFKPHVTLARFRSGAASMPHLERFLVANALFRAGPFPVTDFSLFQSFTSGEGSIYREEAVYPLLPPQPLAVGA
ncbi:MAG TPA: RNA 2',3'-cyclic phosphodiesterase [Kiloniellales bacterium]|nr:RNA 2',3'-cyclic phosphodiesterase [Kiloniellales bacterium]